MLLPSYSIPMLASSRARGERQITLITSSSVWCVGNNVPVVVDQRTWRGRQWAERLTLLQTAGHGRAEGWMQYVVRAAFIVSPLEM